MMLTVWVLLPVCLGMVRGAAVMDFADLVAEYEDEILGRAVGLTKDEEPETQKEGDVGHPEEVHSWDANLQLGQVSAVAMDINDDPVVFHRGPVVWDANSFKPDNTLRDQSGPIPVDTIITIDQFTGKPVSGMGRDLFYMPHSITIDHDSNIWVTDVGLHQVLMIPAGSTTPSLILGTAFVPGSDHDHFCKPTSVAVSKSGNVYVADGYCNNRVVVFDVKGRYITEFKGDWTVVHSIVLFEEEDTLCIADREGEAVHCLGAGLNHPQFLGSRILEVPDLGRVYGIAGHGSALIAVTGNGGGGKPQGLTLDLGDNGRVVDTWGTELKNPHQVCVSREGDTVYVAEIGPNRLRKFSVVAPDDNIFNREK